MCPLQIQTLLASAGRHFSRCAICDSNAVFAEGFTRGYKSDNGYRFLFSIRNINNQRHRGDVSLTAATAK
jgi:hypothetical protein